MILAASYRFSASTYNIGCVRYDSIVTFVRLDAGGALRVAKEIPVPSLNRDHSQFHKAGSLAFELMGACALGIAFVVPWKVRDTHPRLSMSYMAHVA